MSYKVPARVKQWVYVCAAHEIVSITASVSLKEFRHLSLILSSVIYVRFMIIINEQYSLSLSKDIISTILADIFHASRKLLRTAFLTYIVIDVAEV